MTHRPRPWRVIPERDFDDIFALSIVDADENVIAFLDAIYYDDDDLYDNAHLIAAAPETKEQRDELLEALEDLVGLASAAMSDANRGAWGEYDITGELEAARKAIAKAKGEGDDG